MISPALTGCSMEFYVNDGELMVLTEGKTFRWGEMPRSVIRAVIRDMAQDPQALDLLQEFPIYERLRMYAYCKFGGQSPAADITACGASTGEHWDCGCTECPLKPILRNGISAPYGRLTSREVQVAKLIAQGFFGKEIAQKLGISTNTVDNHKHAIFSKTGTATNVDIARWAYQHIGIENLT